MPKARFLSHTNKKNYIVYLNLDLYRTPKPIFIPFAKTQNYIAFENLDL